MKTRLAETKDFETILTINQAGRPGVWPLTRAALTVILTDAPYFYLGEVEGKVAGYIIGYLPSSLYHGEAFTWFKQQYTNFLYIDQVAVAPWLRRAKLGTALYSHAEAFTQAQGLSRVLCKVNLEPPNWVSNWFHRKLGFNEVGMLDLSDGWRVSLLEKSLVT